MDFSVLIAFFNSNSSAVGSLFSSTSFPFFPPFLSSFLGGAPFPPFLFLSSLTSSYRLKILNASEISLSNLEQAPSLNISKELIASRLSSAFKGSKVLVLAMNFFP